jgi:hypothetical protein
MAAWDPGPDPFPSGKITKVTDFEYLDELKFVYHAKVHVDKTPKSRWQVDADFRVRMTVRPKNGAPYPLSIRVPQGMFTDLASVPKLLWSVVGPIGRHLDASIVHDYLYMAWTDYRAKASKRNWDFADAVYLAGMRTSRVAKRKIIYGAVHSPIGWRVFKKKKYTLKERMEEWLPLLDPAHGREG